MRTRLIAMSIPWRLQIARNSACSIWRSIMRHLLARPEGRLVHLPELYTEDRLKTSAVYNEGWRRLRARKGLYAHFDNPDGLRLVWGVGDPAGDDWHAAQLQMIERLLPHIHRSVRMRHGLLVGALPVLWGESPSGGSMTVQRASGRSRLGLHVSPVNVPEADFGSGGWRRCLD